MALAGPQISTFKKYLIPAATDSEVSLLVHQAWKYQRSLHPGGFSFIW
ncbi:hypothetical protein HMPREF9103_01065 [Lentilactobacillus parafarraginis F0439]|uniref:Uncharacterized protein n=1 Tax=Lentilactobacillus parafarraginis F0439 TaxID=797515 RepID=G9ZMW4_9LACO|nr:hypothetical protein HMPREF9103_01065 [Lentilactobacillus parafarraginis F0439]